MTTSNYDRAACRHCRPSGSTHRRARRLSRPTKPFSTRSGAESRQRSPVAALQRRSMSAIRSDASSVSMRRRASRGAMRDRHQHARESVARLSTGLRRRGTHDRDRQHAGHRRSQSLPRQLDLFRPVEDRRPGAPTAQADLSADPLLPNAPPTGYRAVPQVGHARTYAKGAAYAACAGGAGRLRSDRAGARCRVAA